MEIKKSILEGGILISDDEGNVIGFTEDEQRELVVYLWKEKPEMIREIVCESCPEVC